MPRNSLAFWRSLLPAFLLILGALATGGCRRASPPGADSVSGGDFARWMNVGKNYYDHGEAVRAIDPFQKAVALSAGSPEAHLNLANAFLLATQTTNSSALLTQALTHAQKASELDRNLAAAHYVAGCAQLRLRQFEAALKSFQVARDLEPKVGATTFHLARAHQELGHWDDAIALYQELTGFEPDHRAAWYSLSQALMRVGRPDEANAALARLQALAADQSGTMSMAKLERCIHTQARAPFIIEPPQSRGVPLRFVDTTALALAEPGRFHGPLAFIDYHHDGRNSLFVGEGTGFRLLMNSNGVFTPYPQTIAGLEGARYQRCLVADLQNDRYEDILVVGETGCRVFRFATNAQVTDSTAFSRLGGVQASDAVLIDLDFTGKLDLFAVNVTNRTPQLLRNLGNLYFKDITATSGIPTSITGIAQLAVEDWNQDDVLDILVARARQPLQLFLKQRGGPLWATNAPADWPVGGVIAVGDFNNDFKGDLWIAAADHLECVLNGLEERLRIPVPAEGVRELFPIDYDNDGWLDLLVVGHGLRMFRNLGRAGWDETTGAIGLGVLAKTGIESVAAADIDQDGDTDMVVGLAGGGVRLLRNDGGHANLQIKVQLVGNRSNASGLGTRVEITAGGLRVGRRIQRLPVEIGVGQHRTLESLNARWLNLDIPTVDVSVDPKTIVPLQEITLPEGSCPYLYAWDGQRFRFVTDLLGAAPLGLRVSEHRFVEADPDEFVWLGAPDRLAPRNGHYEFRITEELREVLYLDAVELVAVDHPEGTEVYTTGKMVAGQPFPPHEFVTLRNPVAPRHAVRSDGWDCTMAVRDVDQQMAGPVVRRVPQLRGLAEPWSLTLDFGPLPVERPLVLGITGWLRFGGGMANVAASQHPDLPFPFPTLEVEVGADQWRTVDVVFGVPCGKTKSFVVDLTGKLPPGSRRLRIQTAYELYWDRIALLERSDNANTRITRLQPDGANLHYRGFGEFESLPDDQPLTPSYDRVRLNPAWRITPAGWCTRFGDVRELVVARDNALALLNGGDEVAIKFRADRLPLVPSGCRRGFFLYSCGWDKDADFHCEKGWEVEPIPWHGMQDQLYGQQPRPVLPRDTWRETYNTRWVGPWVPRRRG